MDEISQELKDNVLEYINRRERDLSEFASKSEDGLRKRIEQDEKTGNIRTKYSRDCDRIIHTHAYSRYIDKTQVFYLVDNDHVTHRVLHVQLVSKIARTIGRALRLNEDLIEAISLGHDIGHVPYGHIGEKYLSELCNKNKIGGFAHNSQGIHFLENLENRNLTLQVLDGILCHNGEDPKRCINPNKDKNWENLETEYEEIVHGEKKVYAPMTMEGCVVRFSDIIAYLGRDLQDAMEVGLIERSHDDGLEIPSKCKDIIEISDTDRREDITRKIINKLIIDIIENSYEKGHIAYSEEISDCVKEFLSFNYETIYKHQLLLQERPKINEMYKTLYYRFLTDLKEEERESRIYIDFENLSDKEPDGWINSEYLENANDAEKVRDYIAGMTDRYFEMIFKEITFPKRVHTYNEKKG